MREAAATDYVLDGVVSRPSALAALADTPVFEAALSRVLGSVPRRVRTIAPEVQSLIASLVDCDAPLAAAHACLAYFGVHEAMWGWEAARGLMLGRVLVGDEFQAARQRIEKAP